LKDAAHEAGVVVLNGETAELDKRVGGYGPFNYNWNSTALWMVQRERIIDDTAIKSGDILIGFGEDGLRSNGLTAARAAFRGGFGEQCHDEHIEIGGQHHKLGQLALQPSVIYTKTMVDLTGGSDLKREPKAQINGAAHITGGGIPEKLGRTLRNTGLGAEIVEPFEPPAVAMLAQAFHPDNISDEDAYSTWCLGQGMITITPETDADDVIKVATNHGIATKVIGYVTKQPGIRIRSAGIHKAGQLLSYPTP
jgi:phosphoribosylformylglycinamidine cyclo-ligase